MSTLISDLNLLPELLPYLSRLAEADAAVRRIAVLDIADLELEEATPLLAQTMNSDPDRAVRLEAARVLAAWETETAVAALITALTDVDSEVAEAAAQSLSELKDITLGPLLVAQAGHPSPFVRGAILRGLRELRYPLAFAPAVRALNDPDADVRREAVIVLGWLRQTDALPDLARLATSDPAAEVRLAATGALGLVADAKVLPALFAALNDTEWQVREEAATTLGKLRLPDSEGVLLQALDDGYWQVRLRAARALGRLHSAAALDKLTELFSHPVSNLRKEVALALGEIGDTRALPVLQAAWDDADPDVRKSVRLAIAQIGKP